MPTRTWLRMLAILILLTGPIALYFLLSTAGLPAHATAGVLFVIMMKHLGLLTLLLSPVYALFRRRSHQ